MDQRAETIEAKGIVKDVLPHAVYHVELDSGQRVKTHVSGSMRMHCTRLLPGDRVTVEITPYDFSRGRIVQRGS